MRILKTWRFWLGCAISLLCLWLAFRRVPLAELVGTVTDANPFLLLLAATMLLLSVLARAWRWLILLERETGIVDSFWAQSIGFLFTNVFPLRLGEPARILVMADRCRLPVMYVGGSAIVERLLDGAVNIFILLLVLPWMQVPPLMKSAGLSFAVLVLAGFCGLLVIVRWGQLGERFVRMLAARLRFVSAETVVTLWRELVRGLLPLLRWRTAMQAVSLSLITWGCSLAMFWGVLRAFQADGRLLEAAFMMVALSFAVAVPSSPGFVGVFQLVGQQALVIPFGAKYGAAQALAITLTVHLVYYILTTTLGLVGLWRFGQSFVNLGRVIARKEPPGKTSSFLAKHPHY